MLDNCVYAACRSGEIFRLSLLYRTLSVVHYTQYCTVPYTQCCTLHLVFYLTIKVVPTLSDLQTFPAAIHNQNASTMFRWKCVSNTDTASIAGYQLHTALYS